MGGFFDLLALLCGWKSAPAPHLMFRATAGRVWHTGAAAGHYHVAGQRAGQTHTSGPIAGKIHG